MKLFHVVINSNPVLESFSPIEVVDCIIQQCKKNGETLIEIYTTEVK